MKNFSAIILLAMCILCQGNGVGASNSDLNVKNGPSFDCSKASTPTEKAICKSQILSKLDRSLATAYKAAKETIDPEFKNPRMNQLLLTAAQRRWNKKRNSKCGAKIECLIRMYRQRISVLDPGDISAKFKEICSEGKMMSMDFGHCIPEKQWNKSASSSGRSRIYEMRRHYEAYKFGQKIRKVVQEQNVAGLVELFNGELNYGPSLSYFKGKKMTDIFSNETLDKISNGKFSSLPDLEKEYGLGGIWFRHRQWHWRVFSITSATTGHKKPEFSSGWVFKKNTLHPLCFEHNMKTGLMPIHLKRCLEFDNKNVQIENNKVLAENTEERGTDYYEIQERIDIEKCEDFAKALSPPVKGKCLESYKMSVGNFGYGTLSVSQKVIYGLFQMQDGSTQIIPLKIFSNS